MSPDCFVTYVPGLSRPQTSDHRLQVAGEHQCQRSRPATGRTYADDLAALVTTLDLKDAIHVGHSTGGGEVARYIGRHGVKRVAKAVLIGAVPPLMLKTAANPGGLPIEAFDNIRAGVLADRSQF
jgi:pimeloyl-ACP methyl ester carboxylesterase